MLDQNDLNMLAATVQATIAAMRAGGGGEPAFTPSTGQGCVEQGNRDQFFYPVGFTNLAPAGVANVSLQISADSNFYCNAFTYQAWNHASVTALTEATNPIPSVTVLITDTGSSRQLMQGAVPITTIAGDGKRPYRLTRPRLFQRTTSINFQFTNIDSALTLDLTLVLHGFKVYSNGP